MSKNPSLRRDDAQPTSNPHAADSGLPVRRHCYRRGGSPGRPAADQVLLQGNRRHTCQSLHVTFDAGGQAQSASLLLRRQGRRDVRVDTQTGTRGTLDAALRPGRTWQLAASTPSVSIEVRAKGWASCRSGKGLR